MSRNEEKVRQLLGKTQLLSTKDATKALNRMYGILSSPDGNKGEFTTDEIASALSIVFATYKTNHFDYTKDESIKTTVDKIREILK